MPTAAALNEPQQARAIETRRKLLTAARDALMECGYHGATTTEVARRAGVSQGALFRHFPSKAALLSGALEFISEDVLSRFLHDFSETLPEEDFVAAGVEAAWAALDQPQTSALLEILIASRTDPKLRELIRPASMRFYERIYTALDQFAPPFLERPRMTSLLWLMLDMMQGRFLANLAVRDEGFNRLQRELLIRVVRAQLDETAGDPC